jgi:hypothetical protein
MSSSASRLSRPGTADAGAAFQQLTDIALSGDRNGLVDAVERVGVSAMMEQDENGNTLLHVVAATGDLKMIKLLLRLGVALDCMNDRHQTASIVAENCGHVAISEYLNRKLREIKPDIATVALDNDAPVNEDDAGDVEDDFQKEYLDAVLNYAIVIGIDATNEPHLLPIAEEGLAAPLPAEWREQDGVYFNVNTSHTQRDHPNDDVFKQVLYPITFLFPPQPLTTTCSSSALQMHGLAEADMKRASTISVCLRRSSSLRHMTRAGLQRTKKEITTTTSRTLQHWHFLMRRRARTTRARRATAALMACQRRLIARKNCLIPCLMPMHRAR